jgi:hypothetical protein
VSEQPSAEQFVTLQIMAEEIINKVSASALQQIDLEAYFPKEEILVFDLKPLLFMELIVKEKDFREALQKADWSIYQDKIVAVTCSTDAIIPMWAYMLVATYLQPIAKDIVFGDEQTALKQVFLNRINQLDINQFSDQRVVIKGCGDLPVGEYAYMEITKRLRPVAKSIMYGEPCSTVPIFKSKVKS